jgi:hypothetical protein
MAVMEVSLLTNQEIVPIGGFDLYPTAGLGHGKTNKKLP